MSDARSPAARPPLMSLDDAMQRLMAHAAPLGRTERVSTFDADGRVLAQDVVSELQVPPNDNSSMDGYAVRAADVTAAGVELPVSQRIAAGHAGGPLTPGTAARIFTGAPMPAGADAVVMQEDTAALDDGARVRIDVVPAPGQWVRTSGEDVLRGATVLQKGERLAPAGVGLAAGIGLAELTVAARPRVALFSTGDELVMPGQVPPAAMKPGTIYNSNRFFLRALLLRLGCEVTDLGIVPDNRAATLAALQSAATGHDLILTSGGVSVGEEDHIKPAVEQLGQLDLWQIAMKPGKPFAYGSIPSAQGAGVCHFMGLPGNPVSSFVTFLLLVRPFLLRLQGATDTGMPALAMRADFATTRPDKRREFLRARRNADGGLDLFANQSSGVLTSAHWADGLIDLPAGQTIAQGEMVCFIPLREWLA
ncbi:molybdopterin molybdotransferase MoeA [Ottowia sp. GY511]|uniref:Molybdopterin molybdenumtransferase n=1 Tax=Ottowia flava TaxID=2675430 RepID=A0ABW4KZP7_9BURK|nr:gephyrin-like molybdotransferase Glp [Ottowia sp. GY511]TXK24814.1 molybdopterin molybdotransferase MoeA [Ottowia sp. GY511]